MGSGSLRRLLVLLGIACAFVLATGGLASAAPGSLDRSFSGDGQQFVDFKGGSDFGYTVALQGRRILIAGITGSGRSEDLALARLNRNGTLDSTFGRRGRVRTDVGGRADEMSNGLAVLPSGKILVAGDSKTPSGEKLAIVRYWPNGRLDRSFGGGDGKVLVRVGPGDAFGYDLAVLEGGKFIVAGETDPTASRAKFLLVRFTSLGKVDQTFGSSGVVRTRFGSRHDAAYRVVVMPNGKIVACGWTEGASGTFDTAVARYAPSGRLDRRFSGDGKVTKKLVRGGDDFCDAIVPRARGRILLGEFVRRSGNQDMGLLQYRADGRLDPGFSGDGKQILDFGGQENSRALALQSDGKILVAGTAGTDDFALVRLRPRGGVDTAFGQHGVASAPLRGAGGAAFDLVVQSNGRIVVVGEADDGSEDFAATRFLP
jgi:uncharacterized delta-60 repeat protein